MNQVSKTASFLKSKRIEAGLSQQEVAKELGYQSSQFISNVERGLAEVPLKRLRKILDMYGIKQKEILPYLMVDYRERVRTTIRTKRRWM